MILKLTKLRSHPLRLAVVVLFAVTGTYLLILSHAQTPAISLSAVNGSLSGGATNVQCSGSSDNCINFSTTGGGGNTANIPTNLQIIDTSTTQVSLTWSPPSGWTPQTNTITGYNVYRDNTLIATTKPFTTNYLDQGLIPGSSHSYTVTSVNVINESTQTSSVMASLATTTIPISSCPSDSPNNTLFTKSGNYVLTNDIQFSNTYCFNIDNVDSNNHELGTLNNFNLDCQGHSILGDSNNVTFINFINTYYSMVVNCHFDFINQPGLGVGIAFSTNGTGLSSNNFDTVENNSFGNSNSLTYPTSKFNSTNIQNDISLHLTNVSNSVIDNNNLYDGSISLTKSSANAINGTVTNTAINNNNVSTCGGNYCAFSINLSGDNNVSAYNNINGYGGDPDNYASTPPPTSGKHPVTLFGTDDGYTIAGQISSTNNIIAYNNLLNFYDCGIEFNNINNNDYIGYNNITSSGQCGIGGWYANSMISNIFEHNTIGDTPQPFWIFLTLNETYSLGPGSTYYFENNNFTANTELSANIYIQQGSEFNPADGISEINQEGSTLKADNNIFKNNTFRFPNRQLNGNIINTPTFGPKNLPVDGGGNKWCPNNTNPAFVIQFPQLTDSQECSSSTATGWQ